MVGRPDRCKSRHRAAVPEDTVAAWLPCYTAAVGWCRVGYHWGKVGNRSGKTGCRAMMHSCCKWPWADVE